MLSSQKILKRGVSARTPWLPEAQEKNRIIQTKRKQLDNQTKKQTPNSYPAVRAVKFVIIKWIHIYNCCQFFFFFLTSLLEYNCFTMVCQFLLYNKVNQSYTYICPHISSLLHLPPSHPPYPTPLGGHKAPSWSPCAMWLLPTSYLFYVW